MSGVVSSKGVIRHEKKPIARSRPWVVAAEPAGSQFCVWQGVPSKQEQPSMIERIERALILLPFVIGRDGDVYPVATRRL